MSPRELFEAYAPAVVYLSVELPNGDLSIGSAFHVGEGVFVTARHVVDGNKIMEVATTVRWDVPDENGLTIIHGKEGKFRSILPAHGTVTRGPLFHPEQGIWRCW